ncbi:MAG TPA: TolB-like translocation protein [Acidimicrobiia bacterium]|nr:TolB-like translocation protein [Acidimicrobiia bacterium]
MNRTTGGLDLPLPRHTVRTRARVLGFVALTVVCVSTATGYVLHSRARVRAVTQAGAARPVATPEAVAALEAEPHVLFRNMSVAAQAGFAALAPSNAPDGPRQITDYPCRRLYMAAGHGLCLAEQQDDPFGTPYRARFFGPDFKTVHELPLAGLPSRARVSPDGTLGSATVFVNGDSYAAGPFSTRTTIFDMNSGTSLGDLETFTVFNGGKRIQSVDFNFWGVTFARQPGTFYATLGTGGHTYLVHGDLATRTVKVLRDGVECPALSPDGTRIAFKSRVSSGGLGGVKWRISVLSLDTLKDHPLAETRNVDDQAEWLDDGTVLYSVESDTYAVPADGGGAPRLFAHRADSLVVLP